MPLTISRIVSFGDEQAIYNRALTAAELFVSTHQILDPTDPSLLALYTFNEGHGIAVTDRRIQRATIATSAQPGSYFLQVQHAYAEHCDHNEFYSVITPTIRFSREAGSNDRQR